MGKIQDGVLIKIRRETRDKLKKLGVKGETYDDVINKFIAKNIA